MLTKCIGGIMNCLVLISCSHRKKQGGESIPFGQEICTLQKHLSNTAWTALVTKRKELRELLLKGRIHDYKYDKGDRKYSDENRSIRLGPEFGYATEHPDCYLLARKRYRGSFFTNLTVDDWTRADQNGYQILIMSGLYGFVRPDEYIQDYDCHLTDLILADEKESSEISLTVREFWRDILTAVLVDYIQLNRITHILDLLVEENYQCAINWEDLPPVVQYHRGFKKRYGPIFRDDLGLFFKYDVVSKSQQDCITGLPTGSFMKKPYFRDKTDELIFERQIDTAPLIRREADRRYDVALIEKIGQKCWCGLSLPERNMLREAEELYQEKFLSEKKMHASVHIMASYWLIFEERLTALMKYLIVKFADTSGARDLVFKEKKSSKPNIYRLSQLLKSSRRGFLTFYHSLILLGLHTQEVLNLNLEFSDFAGKMLSRAGFEGNRKNNFLIDLDSIRRIRNYYAHKMPDDKTPTEIRNDIDTVRKRIFKEDSPLTGMVLIAHRLGIHGK